MSEQMHKFVLVVAADSVDGGFMDRLTRHMGGLQGTSLTHVALTRQPEPGAADPPAPVIVEWSAAVPPTAPRGRTRSASAANCCSGMPSPRCCDGIDPE